MVEGLKDFQRSGGQHRGNANQKRELRGRRAAQAKRQGQQDRRPGTRSAGEDRREQLTGADRDHDCPGHCVAQGFSAQPAFYEHEENAASEHGPADRHRVLFQFELPLLEDQSAETGQREGHEDFQQIIARGWFAPAEEELVQAPRK